MSVVTQRGFSMIEVLVAIFVLVIGVIGAAAMQVAAFRTSQQAGFQTVALQLATELADKMRANDQATKIKSSNANPFIGIDYSTTSAPAVPNVFCFGKAGNCDAAALANFDIYEWQSRLRAALPMARVVVCRDSTPWDVKQGNYRWECESDATTTAGASVVIKIGWQAKNPDGSLIKDAQKSFLPGIALAVVPYIQ